MSAILERARMDRRIKKPGEYFLVISLRDCAVCCCKLLLGAMVVVLALAACRPRVACHTLLQRKCIRCHSFSTSCAKVGASERRWQETLESMVKLGADISEQDRRTLAGCLSHPEGTDVGQSCKQ